MQHGLVMGATDREQRGAAQAEPEADSRTEQTPAHVAAVRSAGDAATRRMAAQGRPQVATAGDGALSGQLIASNNPEAVYSPGVLVPGCQVGPGKVGVYVHHSNHTRGALDFFLVVRPVGGETLHAAEGGVAAGGPVNEHAAADPNYRTARGALSLHAGAASEVRGEKAIAIGSLAASPNRHDADASPLFDARCELDLDRPAVVDVVCRARGDATAPGKLPMATGNSKMATANTAGRAAGVYQGASFRDAPPPIDLARLDRPFEYLLTSVVDAQLRGAAPTPAALEQKQARALPDKELAALLKGAPTVDQAVLTLLERVYFVSPEWLADKKVVVSGRIDRSAALFQADPSFEAMIVGLLDAAEADRKALEQGATSAARCAAQLAAHPTLGARTDAANYGTLYELHFTLLNSGDSAATAKLALDNRTGAAYRGAIELDGTVVDVFRDAAHGGAQGASPIGQVAVGPARAGEPGRATATLRLMSPGQIASGQAIVIQR